MARRSTLPSSSSNRQTISPSFRWAHPPTTRPSHHTVGPTLPLRSNSEGHSSGARYHSRRCHPIAVGSSAGSNAAHGSAGGPATGPTSPSTT